MKRAEKAQKRFLLMFETADPKEFERRKKRWLRSEALADIEKGYEAINVEQRTEKAETAIRA
jgi:hypothetical protein